MSEAAREAGGDGGRVDGRGGGSPGQVCEYLYDRCVRWKEQEEKYEDEPQVLKTLVF